MNSSRILIFPAAPEGSNQIWAAMERLLPVCFTTSSSIDDAPVPDAIIAFAQIDNAISASARLRIPCLVFDTAGSSLGSLDKVSFTDGSSLDGRLRGRALPHNPFSASALPASPPSTVLARSGDIPIWTKSAAPGGTVDRLGVALPVIPANEHPLDFLHGADFVRLLPLVHFLREVVGPKAWRGPGLRACLMFDDPNLHWGSYGYLPFHEVALLAEQHNFHVACATVPLDSWFAHSSAVSVFREHRGRMSLLIHGNDHLRTELGLPRSEEQDVRLLAQALRRVENLERHSGLHICRVMAPPHGACRPQMLRAMANLGFEGACISAWSLRDWGEGRTWQASLGLEMAELLEENFPVAPRFRMSSSCEGAIVVSAFLDRPIIPVGHHDSLREGIDLLTHIANVINSLGKVSWGDLKSVLRSNYMMRQEGTILHLKPYSFHWSLVVPSCITEIVIHTSHFGETVRGFTCTRASALPFSVPPSLRLAACEGDRMEFSMTRPRPLEYREIPSPAISPWATVRRLICETRDRLQPVLAPVRARPCAAPASDANAAS